MYLFTVFIMQVQYIVLKVLFWDVSTSKVVVLDHCSEKKCIQYIYLKYYALIVW